MKTKVLLSVAVLLTMLNSACTQNLKKKYSTELKHSFSVLKVPESSLLTLDDISHLPEIVQKYIIYSNAIGKEKIYNMRVTLIGGIRGNPDDDFMKLKSVQYNFFDEPTRLFYIKARKMGIPAIGLHIYKDAKALFKVKLMGLFTIVDVNDTRLDQAETVTWFNDLCLMAPAALIDNRISWEEIDPLTVKATFTNKEISVSAYLYFRDNGQLMNFVSYDRFELIDNTKIVNNPFSTPVHEYMQVNDRMIIKSGDAVYQRPEGEFVYGQFVIKEIEYNVGME